MVSPVGKKTSVVVELERHEEAHAPTSKKNHRVTCLANKTLSAEGPAATSAKKRKMTPISVDETRMLVDREITELMVVYKPKLNVLEKFFTERWVGKFSSKLHKCEKKSDLFPLLTEGREKLEKLKKGRSKEDGAVATKAQQTIDTIVQRLKV